VDRDSKRVDLDHAPAQARWYDGVASFLLDMSAQGVRACATSPSSPPSSHR
jgi:hypothetical protein